MQNDMFGTEPYKLSRTNDPITSKAAAAKTDTAKWEKAVYDCIASFGSRGCIQDDILRRIKRIYGDVPYSTVTARFKALQEKGLIRYTEEKRKGASGRLSRVRVAAKYYNEC